MFKFEDIDFDVLIDEKSYENILIYEIAHKTLIGPKLFCIRFYKIDVFIRTYDGTKYLVLFGSEKFNAI